MTRTNASNHPPPTYLPHLQQHHRPRPLHPPLPHPPHPPLEPPLPPLHHLPPAEQAQDPRARPKGAEHDGDAPVLVHVGHGLAAGACGVDVGGPGRGEDGKGGGGEAFGGDVDVGAGEGGGGGEEDLLG